MKNPLLFSLVFLFCFSCTEPSPMEKVIDPNEAAAIHAANKKDMESLMKKHLDAVTNRDLATMESTLTPNKDMQLILPGSEIITSNEGFMDYHREWFAVDTAFNFKTEILNSEVNDNLGMAITQVIYSVPDRNGEPYFNRMIVSYDLEKIDGNWYLMKDHASSIEKSTDKKQ